MAFVFSISYVYSGDSLWRKSLAALQHLIFDPQNEKHLVFPLVPQSGSMALDVINLALFLVWIISVQLMGIGNESDFPPGLNLKSLKNTGGGRRMVVVVLREN